jgi:signal transduction histidine kinase
LEATLDEEYDVEFHIKYNQEEDQLDIIMNNISRSKLFAKQNSEFKYKTLFLSKVTHEFKNPLICITELVNQKIDDLDPIEHKNILSSFNQIKSISDYLCILIKDFNHYTEKEFDFKWGDLEIREINLEEILTFCNSIAEILLKKSNKTNCVNYLCIKDPNLINWIKIDETRLKQVLINLISNAIKFTHNGEIKLEISNVVESELKFTLTDTGMGMPEAIKKNFIEENFKDFNIRSDGTLAFGLSICKNLVRMMGGNLHYVSRNVGTCFSFTIPIAINNNSEINTTKINNNSYEHTYFRAIRRLKSKIFIQNDSEDPNLSGSFIDIINSENNNSILFSKYQSKCFNPEDKKETEIKKISQGSFNKLIPCFNENLSKFNFNSNELNCIIADDDMLPRKSTVRVLRNISKEFNIPINIMEVNDGCEIISVIYKSLLKGIKVSLVLSDENMNFINGTTCAKILKDMENSKNLCSIPFYLNSSYNKDVFEGKLHNIQEIFDKPISFENAKRIIFKIIDNHN